MSIEAALTTIIKADVALDAMIGGRLFPDAAPQGTPKPYCLYMVDDLEDPAPSHDGASGWLRGPLPMLIVADTYQEVTEIAPELRRVLNDYSGIVEGVDVDLTFEGETDNESQPVPGTKKRIYLREQTYRAMFGESA